MEEIANLKYIIECQKNVMEAQRQTLVIQQQLLHVQSQTKQNGTEEIAKLPRLSANRGLPQLKKTMTLKEYLAYYKITLKDFAKKIDVTEVTIRNYMHGKSSPQISIAYLIEEATNGVVSASTWQQLKRRKASKGGFLLHNWRVKNQVIAKDLSKALRITQSCISKYENGWMQPSRNLAEKIENHTNYAVPRDAWLEEL
ncbi:MAG: helix-turn-helix domain-containing protein [Alphaproteobacteria bacterium]